MNEEKNFADSIVHGISRADQTRFREIVVEVMTDACDINNLENDEYGGIGRLGEKQMHAAIKKFICPDERRHEVKIDRSEPETDENGNKRKQRKFVADILHENVIYEIQTGSFSPLRGKIEWILKNTPHSVVLVHPLIDERWLNYIGRDGKVSGHRRSPKHEGIESVAPELFFIRDFIPSERFCLLLLSMDAQEYRTPKGRGRRTEKYQVIPTNLKSAVIFKCTDDYKYFIPENLPERFCAKEYAAASHIYGMDTYSILKTLCYTGLLREDGKIGRAVAYTRTFS